MLGRRLFLTFLAYICLLVPMLKVGVVLAEEAAIIVEDGSPETITGKMKGSINTLETYMRLFKQHRATQLDAVKSIMQFGSNYESRYKLVDTIVKQLFKVLSDAKTNVTAWGYIPGDPIPENATVREGLSKVLENTAMFGDLILRVPDITHAVYKKNKEWEFLIGWAVWVSMESNVFLGADQKMLNLMAQELGLIPKRDDYVNPYKEKELLKQMDSQGQTKQDKKKEKNKKKKEKRKGPRLGGSAHTEL